MLVPASIHQLFNASACFYVEKATALKRIECKQAASMRTENNLKGHQIEQPLKLNYANMSVI